MGLTYLNLTGNSLNLNKFKRNPKNSKLKSFRALMLSIFIYISLFFTFKISPSTFLFSTKFWFFISNILILVIAADFDGFSSSKENDFYQEYVKNGTKLSRDYVKIGESAMPTVAIADQNNELTTEDKPKEKIVDMVVSVAEEDKQSCHENEEKELEIHITKEEEGEGEGDEEENHADHNPDEKCEGKKQNLSSTDPQVENLGIPEEKKRERVDLSSEKEMNIMDENEENHEEQSTFEENEFADMSVEELNIRVEEFIQKMNRQIRLQAAASTPQDLEL